MKGLTIMLTCVILMSCSKQEKVVTSNPTPPASKEPVEEVMGDVQAANNSIVFAKLVDKKKLTSAAVDSPCYSAECIGSFEILSFIQYGANFHGQLEEGKPIEALFEFTLSNTASAFPELNEPLPGLNVGDYFEAELFENVDDGSISIRLYELKK